MIDGGRRSGLLFGAGAYIWWGLCPGFFLLLLPASALEILAHRFVWSAVFLLVLLAVVHRLGDLRRLSVRTWLQLLAAAVFIALNWGTYIWAVTHGHVVDAALGYFINPLVTVLLGVIVFRERLNRWQLLALGLAAVAVVILTAEVGDVPYVALLLALSFSFYGLIKKVVDADPRVSVMVETLWALPFAVGYMAFLEFTHHAHFVNYGAGHTALLMLAGPVTAIPLLLFAAASQRLPLVTLGLLFYLNPGLQMAWGVFVGHEPMPPGRWLGFALIWVGLLVFTGDALLRARRNSKAADATSEESVRLPDPKSS